MCKLVTNYTWKVNRAREQFWVIRTFEYSTVRAKGGKAKPVALKTMRKIDLTHTSMEKIDFSFIFYKIT